MSDMPERIWAFDFWEGNIPRAGDWTDERSEAPEGAAEYIRADVVEAHLSDPSAVRANMLRGTIAKPTVEQIVHLYGREAFQPMIDAAIARALEKACLAVSEHADWPEDEHGRTEQVGLFARVINAIRAITPAPALAVPEVAALVAFAKAHEAWEAKLFADGDWSGECLRLTPELHEEMLEVQRLRNAALRGEGQP